MANRRRKGRSSDRFPLLGVQNHRGCWQQPWSYKMIASWQESYDKTRQGVEKQRHHSADKGLCSQDYGLPSGLIRLWELDHKEVRAPKNLCLLTVVLERTPESPLDSKKIKPVNLKGNQPWIFTKKDGCWTWSSIILVVYGNRREEPCGLESMGHKESDKIQPTHTYIHILLIQEKAKVREVVTIQDRAR